MIEKHNYIYFLRTKYHLEDYNVVRDFRYELNWALGGYPEGIVIGFVI